MSPGNAGITPLIGSDPDSIIRAVQLLKIATLRYAHRLGAGDGRYYAVTAQGSKELSEETPAWDNESVPQRGRYFLECADLSALWSVAA